MAGRGLTKRPKCTECDGQLPMHRAFCSKNPHHPTEKQAPPDPKKQNFKKRNNDPRGRPRKDGK